MPWVVFERDFDWFPSAFGRTVHTSFKKGTVFFVTTECKISAELAGASRPATETEAEWARGNR